MLEMKSNKSTEIKIRTIPANSNPVPRPGTGCRQSTASSSPLLNINNTSQFSPITTEEYEKLIFDDMITAEYLIKLTKIDDLTTVTNLKLSVNTNTQSILHLGDLLPNLKSLDLDGSIISSVRDLGISLKNLEKLSLNDCALSELDGIGIIPSLKVLSVQNNQLTEVTALAMNESLVELNLRGNNVSDISVGDTLSTCSQLTALTLAQNPIEKAPKYRLVVAALIPQLKFLDGSPVDQQAKAKVTNGMILEAASAMQIEMEEMDDEKRFELSLMETDNTIDIYHNKSNGEAVKIVDAVSDSDSNLTHGSVVVLAGGMAHAMRQRRKNKNGKITVENSALAALDQVNKLSLSKSDSNDSTNYLGEGDITEYVLGEKELALLPKVAASSPSHKSKSSKDKDAFESAAASFEENLQMDILDSNLTSTSSRTPRRVNPSLNDLRISTPSPRSGLPPKSPHIQRNASRPQSIASNDGMDVTILRDGKAPSAPFKIPLSFMGEKDDDLDLCDRMSKSNIKVASNKFENNDTPPNRKYSSLVHRNCVLRGADDDDIEDIAIDHKTRHQMIAESSCSSSNSSRGSISSDSSNNSYERPPIFMRRNKQFASTAGNGFAQTSNEVLNNVNAPLFTKPSASSDAAGRFLGFDLKGSLAAINQWVETMDSEDESDDDDELEKMNSAIYHAETLNMSSRCKTASTKKILTRNSIITMCTVAGEELDSASSVGLASADERSDINNDKDDENEIQFFDNNIRKSGVSRSSYNGSKNKKTPKEIPNETSNAGVSVSVSVANIKFRKAGALELSDAVLISMLKLPPKSVPALKSKSSFQDFFCGVDSVRMLKLLNAAYSHLSSLDKEQLVTKRMALLEGKLIC